MVDLAKFAQQYHQALSELLDAIPKTSRENVPPCLNNTAFVIAVSDARNRHAVELIGRDRHEKIIINGVEARPASDKEPGFCVLPGVARLETVLFPGTTNKSSVKHRWKGHAAIHGLYYASIEFLQNHKVEGFEPMFAGADVPFEVTADGSLLTVNCAHGYVAHGRPQIRAIDWLKIFGSYEFVPASESAIRKLAVTDFCAAVFSLTRTETHWSFADFIGNLEDAVDKNVLVLGSYADSTEDRFRDVRAALKDLGYAPFLLKDAPDLPIQKNIEKLFLAVISSSFVVVIDDHASGHIAELDRLLELRFRPVIIVRQTEKPATSFLEDSVLTSDSCRVEVLQNITTAELTPAISWAREWLASQEKQLNAINTWRM